MNEHRDLWWKSAGAELAQVLHLDLPGPFLTKRGGAVHPIQISYESWGTLDERRENAILIVHPLTADCHASGGF
ncbi:MAG: hypothetical protein EHM19_10275, partial [Candidatus Latescibacterota bacterium]